MIFKKLRRIFKIIPKGFDIFKCNHNNDVEFSEFK